PPTIHTLSLHDALPISGRAGFDLVVRLLRLDLDHDVGRLDTLARLDEHADDVDLDGRHPHLRDLHVEMADHAGTGSLGRSPRNTDRKSTRLNSSHVATS